MFEGFKEKYFKGSSMLGEGIYATRDLSNALRYGDYIVVLKADLGRCVEIVF